MPKEDFSKYFTTEVYGPKGWEVTWTSNDVEDAVSNYRRALAENTYPVRLTSPTDASIYA